MLSFGALTSCFLASFRALATFFLAAVSAEHFHERATVRAFATSHPSWVVLDSACYYSGLADATLAPCTSLKFFDVSRIILVMATGPSLSHRPARTSGVVHALLLRGLSVFPDSHHVSCTGFVLHAAFPLGSAHFRGTLWVSFAVLSLYPTFSTPEHSSSAAPVAHALFVVGISSLFNIGFHASRFLSAFCFICP